MIFVSIAVGCVVLLGAWLLWWNLRRIGSARLVAQMPDTVRDEVLAAVDRAGMEDGTPVLLLRVVGRTTADPYSKIGGAPSVPRGMMLHSAGLDGGEFLAQVRLHSPPLPEVWANRVVFLFRDANGELVSRCGEPLDSAAVAPRARVAIARERMIETLRLPAGDTVDNDVGPSPPYDPRSLCRRVPALRQILADYPEAPERLLPHLLVPGIHTHEIDTFLVSLMGGEPELIQEAHGAACPRCSQPMTFLFQLGDELELGGDAPVVYVYGCNDHPAEVQVYVDMH
jgi:hypothetical protein